MAARLKTGSDQQARVERAATLSWAFTRRAQPEHDPKGLHCCPLQRLQRWQQCCGGRDAETWRDEVIEDLRKEALT